MDHIDIEERQVVDRYVMGQLLPEEAERFEEHYLSCPECLDRLALAESLERGFKRAAGEDAAQLAATRQLALVAWLHHLGRSRQAAALSLALLAALAVPGGLAYRELAATRAALGQERARAAAGSRISAEAERIRAELAASQQDLARESAAHSQAAAQLAQALQPQENVPILFLNAERGGAAGGEPTYRLHLPAGAGSAVFALTIDPPHQPAYRAVLRDARGREVWSGGDLRLNEQESLSLSLPSTLLAPGDYTLAVEGLAPGRRPVAAGRFAFRVLPPG